MFAVEIDFHDGISPPETILVRRSNAIIGSSDVAHVVIEGAASSVSELRLVRGLGREFSCYPVRRPGQSSAPPPFLEGTYDGEANVKLGDLTLHITALDVDLLLGPDDFPDRAALRILDAAVAQDSPVFPAIAVLGPRPLFVSFPEGDSILVGRSRQCGLRLDSPDVSNEHARIGVDSESCWVEDVGSTNGTFVNNERISGRQTLRPGEQIRLGAEFVLAPVLSAQDFSSLSSQGGLGYQEHSELEEYPCIVAYGAEVRPARSVLREDAELSLGRDPASDIWVNAAHISRKHLSIAWHDDGRAKATDLSSNGTFVNGKRLDRGVPLLIDRKLLALDLSEGVFVGVCFSQEDEKFFLEGETASRSSGDSSQGPETLDRNNFPEEIPRQNFGDNSSVDSSQNLIQGDFSASSADVAASQDREENPETSFVEQFRDYSADTSQQFIDERYAQEFFNDELYEEDLLRKPYFRGVSRALLVVLIVVLVVCTLVLFIGVFSDTGF